MTPSDLQAFVDNLPENMPDRYKAAIAGVMAYCVLSDTDFTNPEEPPEGVSLENLVMAKRELLQRAQSAMDDLMDYVVSVNNVQRADLDFWEHKLSEEPSVGTTSFVLYAVPPPEGEQ